MLETTSATRAFTIWTNAAADLATLQPGIAAWPVPSLTIVRGSRLGAANFASYFPAATELPEEWRVPMEQQFDAVLYLGPVSSITYARPSPLRCSDPILAEQLRRMALSPLLAKQMDRVKQRCTPD